jgi:hypothetical protein
VIPLLAACRPTGDGRHRSGDPVLAGSPSGEILIEREGSTDYSSSQAVEELSWQSICDIDLNHSFIFDHPLDHVPGIMLIVELLRHGRCTRWRQSQPH